MLCVQEVMHIFCPASHTCVRCSINWHWFKSCHFQAVVYCPPGVIAGFVRRVFVPHTICFIILYSVHCVDRYVISAVMLVIAEYHPQHSLPNITGSSSHIHYQSQFV